VLEHLAADGLGVAVDEHHALGRLEPGEPRISATFAT
jgi:hypothetical protein